jgi:hypothetical protein
VLISHNEGFGEFKPEKKCISSLEPHPLEIQPPSSLSLTASSSPASQPLHHLRPSLFINCVPASSSLAISLFIP